VHLLRVEADGVSDADDAGLRAGGGVEAERADAAGDDEADVAVLDAVRLDALALDVDHLLPGDVDLEADAGGGLPEAVHVLAELEDLAVVDSDALEDAVSVEQTVVVDAHRGLALGNQASINPDEGAILCGHVLGRIGGSGEGLGCRAGDGRHWFEASFRAGSGRGAASGSGPVGDDMGANCSGPVRVNRT